jgi:hypothetical protein
MEHLGLHNKPKAAVHPEHLLTNPKEEEKTAHPSYDSVFTDRHGVITQTTCTLSRD